MMTAILLCGNHSRLIKLYFGQSQQYQLFELMAEPDNCRRNQRKAYHFFYL